MKEKHRQIDKLCSFLYALLVKIQYISLKIKIEPTIFNLTFMKGLMLIQTFQELKLISFNSALLQKQFSLVDSIQSLSHKYMIDKNKYFDYDSLLINMMLLNEIVYFTILTILFLTKKERFKFLSQFFKYFSIIYHNIFLIPTIYESFYHIIQLKYLSLSILTLFLRLFHSIFHCLTCSQNKLIEIETCHKNKLGDLMNFSVLFIVCFVVQQDYNYVIGPLILLFGRLFLLRQRLHIYNYLTWFYILNLNFSISFIITLLIQQSWQDLVIIILFINCVTKMIRLRRLGYLLQQNEHSLFQHQILKNQELQQHLHYFHKFFCKIKKNTIELIEKQIIKQGTVSEKIKFFQFTYQFKKNLLYFNLISLTKEKLNYWHKLNLEANIKLAIDYCQNQIEIPLNIKQFAYALFYENESYESLLKLLQVKQDFYKSLLKSNSTANFMTNIKTELEKTLIFFESFKQQFEKKYDIQKGSVKNCLQSDFITMNIIEAYLILFYGDRSQAKLLRQRCQDFLAYDRNMNFKIQKNEVIFIQQSFIKQQDVILNCKNKRISQLFRKINYMKDLFAEFNYQIYCDLINQYFLSGYEIELPQIIYLKQDNYLLECEIYFFATISKDDIIINNLLVIRNQPNDFLIFDIDGKIKGITSSIFHLFFHQIINNDKYKFDIYSLITKGLIQYYVQDIYQQIIGLSKLLVGSQMQQAYQFQSKWYFPSNHKKCLEQTLMLLSDKGDDQNSSSNQIKSIYNSIYNSTIVRMKSIQLDFLSNEVDEEDILQINEIKINMMKQSKIHRVQTLMKQSKKLKPIPFEGNLEFISYKSNECQQSYFILRFKQVENVLQQSLEMKIVEKKLNEQLEITDNPVQNISQEYLFIQQIINKNKFYTPLKFILVVTSFMIAINILSLYVNYKINYDNMINQQDQVTFLTMPQAMTFNVAANFNMLWNYYCVINQFYETSLKLEQIRKVQLKNYFYFWQTVHTVDSLKLSILSQDFGYTNLTWTNYNQGQKQTNSIEFLNYYDLMREVMYRQYKNINFNDTQTFDPQVFKTDGIVRQNMLQIFKYHNHILDEIIEQTQRDFTEFVEKSTAFSLYFGIIFFIFLITFFTINNGIQRTQSKFVRLLAYLNDDVLFESNQQISQQKKLIQSELQFEDQQFQCVSSDQNEKLKKTKQKQKLQTKIENYSESMFSLIAITLIIGTLFILFTFGSQMIANLYNYKYKDSLILTMNYLRLKSRLDSTILIGKLVKTEQFIPDNNIEFINQTEQLEYFFNSVNVILNISNQINDQLIITDAYNETFQQRLIQIFNNNLCIHYSMVLSFCKVNNSTLSHLEIENYSSFINSGLFGMTQSLNTLISQEFTQEQSTFQYDFDWSRAKSFLNLPIHYHLFLYYPMEIQLCFYFCYKDIFSETKILSIQLSDQIYIYLICASIGFAFFTVVICVFWIKKQYQYLERLKLIVMLFPPQLIQQNGFNKLLCRSLAFYK